MDRAQFSRGASLAVFMGLCVAGTAHAQQAVTPDAEQSPPVSSSTNPDADIVVTANRRAQRLQDVGISISQFSGTDLVKQGILSTTDIAQRVPGVYVSGAFGGQSQQFTIRGVTQSDFLDTIENPVAFYIDDVYVVAPQGQSLSLLDIDRVEILKGPQGTLFGRNATGGLVQNIIAKPRLGEYQGYGQLTYGRFNNVNGQGALNVPIGSNVALRASALYTRIDNHWDNIYPNAGPGSKLIRSFAPSGATVQPAGGDLAGGHTLTLRGQVLFEPSSALSVRLTGAYSDSRQSVAPYTNEATIATVDDQDRVIGSQRVAPGETRLAIGPGGVNYTGPTVVVPVVNGVLARPVGGGTFFGYVPVDPGGLQLSSAYSNGDLNHTRAQIYAGHVDYDLGGAQLSSITSYQKYYKNFYLTDGTPNPTIAFGDESHTEAWSQEIRLSGKTDRLNWQAGAFYLDNRVDVLQGIIEPPGSALANLAGIFGGAPILAEVGNQLNAAVHFRSRSISVFGQAEYKFADRWTAILGARYIHERQNDSYREFNALNVSSYQISDIATAPSFQPDYDNARTFNLWTGKAQIEFRPTPGLLLYAGINRGVKAGNYNAPATFSPADIVPTANIGYKPETLLSYEGGAKWTRGPLTLAGSGFYYDYRDYQAFVFSTAAGVVRNVDAKVYGADVDASLRIATGLRLGASFAYQHASIPNFAIAPGVLRTVRPPYSPRTQATGSVDYTVPGDLFGGQVSFNTTVNYAGAIYNNIRNFESQRFAGRTLLDLAATWENKKKGITLTVFGKNVTDERYGQIGFDNTTVFGGQLVSYGPPASYGATLGVKF